MKAYVVDDGCYWVFTVEVSEDYIFEGQYTYFRTFEEARTELTKVIQADIEDMKASLKELAQLREDEVVSK